MTELQLAIIRERFGIWTIKNVYIEGFVRIIENLDLDKLEIEKEINDRKNINNFLTNKFGESFANSIAPLIDNKEAISICIDKKKEEYRKRNNCIENLLTLEEFNESLTKQGINVKELNINDEF